jgi:hypothetical protein
MTRVRNLENIPEGTCVCSICKEDKDNTKFGYYLERHTKDGYRLRVNTWCDTCSKIKGTEVRKAEKAAAAAGRPRSSLRFGDKCDCCNRPVYKSKKSVPTGVDGRWSWQCDHDHETGEFRGWICKTCNTGVCSGSLEDAERAIVYMKRSRERNDTSRS